LTKPSGKWGNPSSQIWVINNLLTLPLSESADEDEIFWHGMQSILLSSARKKSKTMKATKAVTCRRKSKRTASAAKEAWHKMVLQSWKEELKLKKKKN
jgi:hypothetical protein